MSVRLFGITPRTNRYAQTNIYARQWHPICISMYGVTVYVLRLLNILCP